MDSSSRPLLRRGSLSGQRLRRTGTTAGEEYGAHGETDHLFIAPPIPRTPSTAYKSRGSSERRKHGGGCSTTWDMAFLVSAGNDMRLWDDVTTGQKKKEAVLCMLFPLWLPHVDYSTHTDAVTQSALTPFLRNVHNCVQDLSQDDSVSGTELVRLLGWLFRLILVEAVEPHRQFNVPALWQCIRGGDIALAREALESDFLDVAEGHGQIYIRVALSEAAGKKAAALHQYLLAVDCYSTPFPRTEKLQKASVKLRSISSLSEFSMHESYAMQESSRKEELQACWHKLIGWTRPSRDSHRRSPPHVAYHPSVELSNTWSNRQLGRFFARYDGRDKEVLENRRLAPHEILQTSLFRQVDRTRLIYLTVTDIFNIDYAKLIGLIPTWHALHDELRLVELKDSWADIGKVLVANQPINNIRSYFGEIVATRFAYQETFACSMQLLALLGLALATMGFLNLPYKDKAEFFFTVYVMVWATWFVQRWARQESRQRAQWGLSPVESMAGRDPCDPLDVSLVCAEDTESRHRRILRRLVQGFAPNMVSLNRRTGNWKKQLLRVMFSYGVTGLACASVLSIFFGKNFDPLWTCVVSAVKPVLLSLARRIGRDLEMSEQGITRLALTMMYASGALAIKCADSLWSRVVPWLTRLENHSSVQMYYNAAFIKDFAFKATVYFSPMIYIACFEGPSGQCTPAEWVSPDDDPRCTTQLRVLLTTLFLIHILSTASGKILKWMQTRRRDWTGAAFVVDSDLQRLPLAQERELLSRFATFTVQLGLVSFFTVVFPLLPLVAMLADLVEARVEAIAFCSLYRRPFPSRIGMITAWRYALKMVSAVALVTNAYMLEYETVSAIIGPTRRLLRVVLTILLGMTCKEVVHTVYPEEGKKEAVLRAKMAETLNDALWGPRGDAAEILEIRGLAALCEGSELTWATSKASTKDAGGDGGEEPLDPTPIFGRTGTYSMFSAMEGTLTENHPRASAHAVPMSALGFVRSESSLWQKL